MINSSIKKLIPIYENKKSYYNKATIKENNRMIKLYSYNTNVVTIHKNTDFSLGEVIVNGIYSVTTLRHIKEFLKQYGFKADSKDQIIDDYIK